MKGNQSNSTGRFWPRFRINNKSMNKSPSYFPSTALMSGIALTLIVSLVHPCAGLAGTVNVNFTDTSASVSGALDGTGILGGGIWSRIINDQGAIPFALRDSNDVPTGVSVVNGSVPSGDSQGNGNPVQNESWFSLANLALSINGLVPNGSYRLACYSDVDGFLGFVSPTTLYTANGVSATTTNGTASARSLPGTSGIDYALITAKANGSGVISLTAAQIAGLQIQGVLPGENGPKMDCMITRSANSKAGKGQGVFGIKPNRAQSLSQRANGAAKTYFVNVKNAGAEFDSAFLMAFPDAGVKLRVIDQATRKNVTAAAVARRYRFDIDSGNTMRFTVQVSSASGGQTGTLNAGIGASPSTLNRANQDVVTCVLKP
jgi:hypothetical protein